MLRDITLENIEVTLRDETFAPGPVENFVVKNVAMNGRPYSPPAPGTTKP